MPCGTIINFNSCHRLSSDCACGSNLTFEPAVSCIARKRYHSTAKLHVGGYSSTTAPAPCKEMPKWAISRALTCRYTLYSHNAAALAVACKASFGERFMVLPSCNIAQRSCKSERQRRIQADLLHVLARADGRKSGRCSPSSFSASSCAAIASCGDTFACAAQCQSRGSCTTHAVRAYMLPERCAHLRLDVYRQRRGSVFSGCSG